MVRFATEQITISPMAQWAERIEAEYREVPGLSLTMAQAARFFGLEPEICLVAFAELTAQGRLRRTPQGRFVDAGWRRRVMTAPS